jgi:hypothetical protein
MKKAIHIQTQGIEGNTISPTRPVSFVCLHVDNIKLTIDAYKGSGYSGDPRVDCLMQLVDEREVIELTPELMMKAVRFFIEYNKAETSIIHHKNTYHYVMRDAIKPPRKG